MLPQGPRNAFLVLATFLFAGRDSTKTEEEMTLSQTS